MDILIWYGDDRTDRWCVATSGNASMAAIKTISWDASRVPEDGAALDWWGGFFVEGMRWKDYLANFDQELHSYLEAARKSAIENNIKATGFEHQNGGVTPVFSDGRYFSLTLRAWGDFMAAVWSEAEDRDSHCMEFYW